SVDHPTIWRPAAAPPGGQERRCPPYESAIDSVSVPDVGRSASFRPPSAVCTEALTGGQREALTTLRSGARPLPRLADKSDVVRATNLRSTPCLCLMQGGRRLSGRRVRCAPKP